MVYRPLGGCLYFDDDGKMPRKTVEVREPSAPTQTTTRIMLGSNPGREDPFSIESANATTQLRKTYQEEPNSKRPSYLLSGSEFTTLYVLGPLIVRLYASEEAGKPPSYKPTHFCVVQDQNAEFGLLYDYTDFLKVESSKYESIDDRYETFWKDGNVYMFSCARMNLAKDGLDASTIQRRGFEIRQNGIPELFTGDLRSALKN